jgi:MFS family permease
VGTGPLHLRRHPLTWALYTWFGTWGWFIYAIGPTVPLLRAEHGTSRSVAALHGTMLAVGAVVAASLGVALTRRLGRRVVVAGGASLVVLGVALLLLGAGLPATLGGALLAGIGGSSALNATSPALAEHHGPAGAAAIAEGNAVAAVVGAVAPLALGAAVAAGLGWRPAIAVTVPLAVATAVLVLRLPSEPALGSGVARREPGTRRAPMGGPFWALLGVVSAAVGIEFSTTFWAGDLLQARLGLTPGGAAAGVAAFVAGLAAGRFVAGRLALRVPVPTLMLGAMGLAALGWLLLWSTPVVPLALTGLLLQGLGVACLFPLAIASLMGASGGRPDAASAWASAGAGIAIGAAPFALGALSDLVGPHRGFLLIPALLAVTAVLLLASGTVRSAGAVPVEHG